MDVTRLELAFPRTLIDMFTGAEKPCKLILAGRTVSDQGIHIEIEQLENDDVRLLISGNTGFVPLVEDIYKCHICSVKEVKSETSHPPESFSDNDATENQEAGKVFQKEDRNPSSNIRRSARAHVRNNEGIVKRLHLVGRRKSCDELTRNAPIEKSTRKRGRPRKELETAGSRAGGDFDEKLVSTDGSTSCTGKENVSQQTPAGEPLQPIDVSRKESGIKQTNEELDHSNFHSDGNQDVDEGLFLAIRTKDSLSMQMKQKLEQLAFKCPYCRYAALNVGTFKYHLRAHHGLVWKDYKIKHGACSSLTRQRSVTVGSNSDGVNNGVQSEEKASAGKLSASDGILQVYHRERCKGTKPRKACDRSKEKNKFVCELCGLKYRTKGSLTLHLRNKHRGNARLLNLLKELHKNSEGRKSELQTECPFCKEACFGQRIFTHMKVSHLGEQDFSALYKSIEKQYHHQAYQRNREDYVASKNCPYCGVELKKCSLRRHMENHCKKNSLRQRRFHCHLCHYYTTKRSDLDEHKRTIHRERRPEYVCEVCGACYHTPVGLRQHSRIKHQMVWKKPLQWWTCQECSKRFPSRLNLERHEPVHTKEYRHTCTSCGKRFKDPSSLQTHHRNIHQGRYRYTCERCGHGMERKSYLERHRCERIRKPVEVDHSQNEPPDAELLSGGKTENAQVWQNDHCNTRLAAEQVLQNSTSGSVQCEVSLCYDEQYVKDVSLDEQDQMCLSPKECSQQEIGGAEKSCPRETITEALASGNFDSIHAPTTQPLEGYYENDSMNSFACSREDQKLCSDLAGTKLQSTFSDDITFVVHQGDDRVPAGAGTLDEFQTQNGSVIVMEAEMTDEVMVSNNESITIDGEQVIAMNAALSDGSTIFLLPSSSLSQKEKH